MLELAGGSCIAHLWWAYTEAIFIENVVDKAF